MTMPKSGTPKDCIYWLPFGSFSHLYILKLSTFIKLRTTSWKIDAVYESLIEVGLERLYFSMQYVSVYNVVEILTQYQKKENSELSKNSKQLQGHSTVWTACIDLHTFLP